MSSNSLSIVSSYLKSLHIHCLETWIQECVQYYQQNNPNLPLSELKREVYEQWLLVNLRELKVTCLPPNLSKLEKTILPGKYVLQVEEITDASVSAYSQLQKIRKVDTENIEITKQAKDWDMKAKRCLTFTLSDGVQEIRGMEYQPIPQIRLNDPELLPGFKILILGPVICRKGMILMKADNVKVYGGEVDTMCTSHSLEAILSKKLNLEVQGTTQNSVVAPDPVIINTHETLPQQPNNENEWDAWGTEDNLAVFMSEGEDEMFKSVAIDEHINGCLSGSSQSKKQKRSHDVLHHANNSCQQTSRSTSSAYGTLTSNHTTQLKTNSTIRSVQHTAANDFDNAKLGKYPAIDRRGSLRTLSNNLQDIPSTSSLQDSSTNDFNNRPTEATKGPTLVNREPFVYLKQILDQGYQCKDNQYVIKAVIITLLTKIGIQNDEFTLKAMISDGSASLEAEFSSMVLENILGFSPCEMLAMIKEKDTNSAIADRIRKAFQRVQQLLISLNCLMQVCYSGGQTLKITQLMEVRDVHLAQLKARQLNY